VRVTIQDVPARLPDYGRHTPFRVGHQEGIEQGMVIWWQKNHSSAPKLGCSLGAIATREGEGKAGKNRQDKAGNDNVLLAFLVVDCNIMQKQPGRCKGVF